MSNCQDLDHFKLTIDNSLSSHTMIELDNIKLLLPGICNKLSESIANVSTLHIECGQNENNRREFAMDKWYCLILQPDMTKIISLTLH